jgi:hypothetical protein
MLHFQGSRKDEDRQPAGVLRDGNVLDPTVWFVEGAAEFGCTLCPFCDLVLRPPSM